MSTPRSIGSVTQPLGMRRVRLLELSNLNCTSSRESKSCLRLFQQTLHQSSRPVSFATLTNMVSAEHA